MYYLCCLTSCLVYGTVYSVHNIQDVQTMSDIKTFTADEMARKAAQVYRAADVDGIARINNTRYPDKIFELTARERRVNLTEEGKQDNES